MTTWCRYSSVGGFLQRSTTLTDTCRGQSHSTLWTCHMSSVLSMQNCRTLWPDSLLEPYLKFKKKSIKTKLSYWSPVTNLGTSVFLIDDIFLIMRRHFCRLRAAYAQQLRPLSREGCTCCCTGPRFCGLINIEHSNLLAFEDKHGTEDLF